MKKNIYTIAVSFEVITEKSAITGGAERRGWEFQSKDLDYEGLKDLMDRYVFADPSSPVLEEGMWFTTLAPVYDSAYYDRGNSRPIPCS